MGIIEPPRDFAFIVEKLVTGQETSIALYSDNMLSKLNKQDTEESN